MANRALHYPYNRWWTETLPPVGFLSQLGEKVNNKSNQLSYLFIINAFSERYFSFFHDVRRVSFVFRQEYKLVSSLYTMLYNIYELELSYTRIESLKDLKNIKVLTLHHAWWLVDISPISKLSLKSCRLIVCPRIVDMSALFGIPDIYIERCDSVMDVSCLGNHKSVYISGNIRCCLPNFLEVRRLAFHSLLLQRPAYLVKPLLYWNEVSITNLDLTCLIEPQFVNLQSLDFKSCCINNFTDFANAKTVKLCCYTLKEITNLCSIPFLTSLTL
jgi:hypothetical protein